MSENKCSCGKWLTVSESHEEARKHGLCDECFIVQIMRESEEG